MLKQVTRCATGAAFAVLLCMMGLGCEPEKPEPAKRKPEPSKPAQPEVKRLKCMERFGQKNLIIGVWQWGDRFPTGVKFDHDIYIREVKEAGFNSILGGPYDLDAAKKYGMNLMVGVCKGRLPQIIESHKKLGDHPSVIGYHLNDNCALHGYTVECAKWLAKNAPDKIPWISTNPDTPGQSRVPMPVISTQAYSFAYGAGRPHVVNRASYGNMCEGDRSAANRYGMAVWTVMGLFSHTETPSVYRFQANAAVAYGAKGIWVFAYNRYFRPVLTRASLPTNRYLLDVVGPRTLGHRSVRVFHTGPDLPGGCDQPAAGRLIGKMDDHLMAGVFVPEDKMLAHVDAPEYIMVVDKRTIKSKNHGDIISWTGGHSDGERPRPKSFTDAINKLYEEDDANRRKARIQFGRRVRSVKAFLPDGTVKACKIDVNGEIELPSLRGGEGILLGIDAVPVTFDPASSNMAVWTVPNKWKFSLDKQNRAAKDKWADPKFDESKWQDILTDKHGGWYHQGHADYRGFGWYRLKITVPGKFSHRNLYLHFGAADEEAWIFIDGQLAFEHSRRTTRLGFAELWTRPFFFNCSKFVKPGRDHTIVVQVYNNYGTGGLYKPIHLIGSDKELDRARLWETVSEHEKRNTKTK